MNDPNTLLKLPNGSWVLPAAIQTVEAVKNLRPYVDGDGHEHSARVVVGTRNGSMNIGVDDYALACRLRDQLAAAYGAASHSLTSAGDHV